MDNSNEVLQCANQRIRQVARAEGPTRFGRDSLLIAVLVLISVLLRIAWAGSRNFVIENEGAEYTRIAMNLAAGKGYVGTMAGPQLLFPPLYPVLIRIGLFLTHSAVASARSISIIAGTLLVLLTFLIAKATYGIKTAWIAANIAALHPILVGFSASTFSECLYATLLAGVVYFGLESLGRHSIPLLIALGSMLGLAYLTRPEVIAQIIVLALLLGVVGALQLGLRRGLSGMAIVLATSMIFAAPYISYLAQDTHHFRLEGKSEVNYALISRINSGMDPLQASFGLSDAGIEEGPLLNPNSFIGKSGYRRSPGEIARFFLLAMLRNARGMYQYIVPVYFWLPLFALCSLGLLRSSWSQQRLLHELLLTLMFMLACVPMLLAPFISWRFALPIVLFVLVWAAKGIDEVSIWVRETVHNLLPARKSGRIPQAATIAILTAAILISGAKAAGGVEAFREAQRGSLYMKEAGLALASRAAGKTVMDSGTVVSFYSGATWLPTPVGSPPAVLSYVNEHRPDFIVIHTVSSVEGEVARALLASADARPLFSNEASGLIVFELNLPERTKHEAQ